MPSGVEASIYIPWFADIFYGIASIGYADADLYFSYIICELKS